MPRKYDMTNRDRAKHFRDVKNTQDELLKFADECGKTHDVIGAPGHGKSRAVRRQEFRLKHIPKNCRCPVCEIVKTDLRSWVVKLPVVVCLSCWRKKSKQLGEYIRICCGAEDVVAGGVVDTVVDSSVGSQSPAQECVQECVTDEPQEIAHREFGVDTDTQF